MQKFMREENINIFWILWFTCTTREPFYEWNAPKNVVNSRARKATKWKQYLCQKRYRIHGEKWLSIFILTYSKQNGAFDKSFNYTFLPKLPRNWFKLRNSTTMLLFVFVIFRKNHQLLLSERIIYDTNCKIPKAFLHLKARCCLEYIEMELIFVDLLQEKYTFEHFSQMWKMTNF